MFNLLCNIKMPYLVFDERNSDSNHISSETSKASSDLIIYYLCFTENTLSYLFSLYMFPLVHVTVVTGD